MKTAQIFWQLLKTDLIQIRKNFLDEFINLIIWSSATIFVNVYVMEKMGLSRNYGEIIVAGMIVSTMWFQMISHIFTGVADFNGERHIDYYFTLPISNTLVFMKSACVYIINAFLFAFIGLCLCKITLLGRMDLSKISLIHLIIGMTLASSFFGFFTLFLVSLTKHPGAIGNVISRIIFPLWFLGGFLFPWFTLYNLMPTIGLINLLNPYVHMTETLRVATVGSIGFLPFWPSCIALVVMTIIVGYIGIYKLKKRLDFI